MTCCWRANSAGCRDCEDWASSTIGVWSPTSLASGFLVDARGLIATHRGGVGRATSVEVQVSPTVKVPARVLVADAAQDVGRWRPEVADELLGHASDPLSRWLRMDFASTFRPQRVPVPEVDGPGR